jgi:peptidoglycan/xylan/chitin deacetylase (PgdA/CDA1 family)
MKKPVTRNILLSFDIEEFDTPLEYGKTLDLETQFQYSKAGLGPLLSLLSKHRIQATFFTTANIARRFPELIREMSGEHEIASHGYYHSQFKNEDLASSKKVLEDIVRKEIVGFRMARMMPVDDREIEKSGYLYNASLHPTFIPGRYNNFFKPRVPFLTGNLVQIPASVTPVMRFPVFWLSFKNFPLGIIKTATKKILNHDGFANFYFHPWEFTDISDKDKLGLPFYISRLSGDGMLNKLEQFILWAEAQKVSFITYSSLAQSVIQKQKEHPKH